jgi:hypothetical protein
MQALGLLLPLDDFCPVRWAPLSNTPDSAATLPPANNQAHGFDMLSVAAC